MHDHPADVALNVLDRGHEDSAGDVDFERQTRPDCEGQHCDTDGKLKREQR